MGIRQDDMQTKWVLDEMVVDDLTVDQMRNGQSGCRRGENKPVNIVFSFKTSVNLYSV